MVAALWAGDHPECPLAVNLDGHGNGHTPTRRVSALSPDRSAGPDHLDDLYQAPVLNDQPSFTPSLAARSAKTSRRGRPGT
jgi:hypothetical protein